MNSSRAISLRVYTFLCLVIGLLTVLDRTALGQAASRPDRGIRPVGSYSISELESISLTNGNLNLSIPLAGLPPMAGGKLSWVVRANYNSKNWDVTSVEHAASPPFQGWTESLVQLSNGMGWQVGGTYTLSLQDRDQDHLGILDPNDPARLYRWKMVLNTPDGATHELRPVGRSSFPDPDYVRGFFKDTPRADSQNTTLS